MVLLKQLSKWVKGCQTSMWWFRNAVCIIQNCSALKSHLLDNSNKTWILHLEVLHFVRDLPQYKKKKKKQWNFYGVREFHMLLCRTMKYLYGTWMRVVYFPKRTQKHSPVTLRVKPMFNEMNSLTSESKSKYTHKHLLICSRS